jgi:hypothetical protein
MFQTKNGMVVKRHDRLHSLAIHLSGVHRKIVMPS